MNLDLPRVAALLAALLLLGQPAFAGEGHDHGDTAPAASGTARPRFAAQSEAFELVGVLDGQRLTLYLDRYADNAPVTDAAIELDIAGAKLAAEPHDGEYEVRLAEAPRPGVLPITATVTAGAEVDLLAGELHVHEDAHVDAHATGAWKTRVAWALGGLAVVAAVALVVRAVRSSRVGGAA